MSDPLWLRAAVVVAGLAGVSAEEAFASLDPIDAAVAVRRLAALRSMPDRAVAAAALAREAVTVARHPPTSVAADPAAGARFLARWMRGLAPADRAAVARGLDAVTARAVAAVASSAHGARPLDPARSATASWLVARACTRVGSMPTAPEWSELLAGLAGRAAVSDAAMLRVERGVRVAGRRGDCAELAAEFVPPEAA